MRRGNIAPSTGLVFDDPLMTGLGCQRIGECPSHHVSGAPSRERNDKPDGA